MGPPGGRFGFIVAQAGWRGRTGVQPSAARRGGDPAPSPVPVGGGGGGGGAGGGAAGDSRGGGVPPRSGGGPPGRRRWRRRRRRRPGRRCSVDGDAAGTAGAGCAGASGSTTAGDSSTSGVVSSALTTRSEGRGTGG